jgi:hypothetical protein
MPVTARTWPTRRGSGVFMSYSEIDKEWRRFQYLAHKGKPHGAPAAIKGYVAVASKP